MNFNKTLVALIASLALANGVYAANKTGVTDSLNSGESRADLAYSSASLSPSGTITSGATSTAISVKVTGTQLSASYLFGLTDRLNVGIIFGLSETTNIEASYTIAPNSYVATTKYNGASDPIIGAQYLLADKKDGNMGLVVYGTFSPATAASDAPVTEVKTNGAITTAGVAGKSGNGYTTTRIGTTVSTPVSIGDVFFGFDYSIYGEKTTNGVTSKNGAEVDFQFGVESKVSATATIRPYVRITSVGSGYSGADQNASYSGYDLGLTAINDVSKNVSLSVTGEYNSINNVATNYANGNKFSYSGTGYSLGLRGMFFF